MNILLIGGGGREHALAWSLRAIAAARPALLRAGQSRHRRNMASASRSTSPTDAAVLDFCQQQPIGLVVVGPEAPLVAGHGRRPDGRRHQALRADAGRRRGSKAPRASPRICAPPSASRPPPIAASGTPRRRSTMSREQGAPMVDQGRRAGGGQGRDGCETSAEAVDAVTPCFAGRLRRGRRRDRDRGRSATGEEASFFALATASTPLPLRHGQDHKRVGDGDTGPNTGGMGAYSPGAG